jgi:hypothetical protein
MHTFPTNGRRPERGAPERRKRTAKTAARDLLPAPEWKRDENKILLDVDGALGCMLWSAVRDVRLWASFDPAPSGLFGRPTAALLTLLSDAVGEAPELDAPLRAFFELVRAPASSSRMDVSSACLLAHKWANERNYVEVALAFAEAAAHADPGSAEAAAVAGSACLRVTPDPDEPPLDVRATLWLRRAARLARRAKNWEWDVRAHIRLGLLLYNRGLHHRARRVYERAAWMAHWRGLDELAGKAHHDLVAIESYVGGHEAAVWQTGKALELYPLRSDRIPYLVHDFAFAMMRHGFYAASLTLLEAVWDHIPPANRLIINGTIARVSAGMRNRERYEFAASHVALLSELCEDGSSWAYLHIAEGARSFGEWDRAESYAARALAIAMRRREPDAQRTAYELLDSIMLRQPAAQEHAAPPTVKRMVETCLERLAKLRDRIRARCQRRVSSLRRGLRNTSRAPATGSVRPTTPLLALRALGRRAGNFGRRSAPAAVNHRPPARPVRAAAGNQISPGPVRTPSHCGRLAVSRRSTRAGFEARRSRAGGVPARAEREGEERCADLPCRVLHCCNS